MWLPYWNLTSISTNITRYSRQRLKNQEVYPAEIPPQIISFNPIDHICLISIMCWMFEYENLLAYNFISLWRDWCVCCASSPDGDIITDSRTFSFQYSDFPKIWVQHYGKPFNEKILILSSHIVIGTATACYVRVALSVLVYILLEVATSSFSRS